MAVQTFLVLSLNDGEFVNSLTPIADHTGCSVNDANGNHQFEFVNFIESGCSCKFVVNNKVGCRLRAAVQAMLIGDDVDSNFEKNIAKDFRRDLKTFEHGLKIMWGEEKKDPMRPEAAIIYTILRSRVNHVLRAIEPNVVITGFEDWIQFDQKQALQEMTLRGLLYYRMELKHRNVACDCGTYEDIFEEFRKEWSGMTVDAVGAIDMTRKQIAEYWNIKNWPEQQTVLWIYDNIVHHIQGLLTL